jgi:hypothetical protein
VAYTWENIVFQGNYLKLKTKLHGRSPKANYTDRATAACRLRQLSDGLNKMRILRATIGHMRTVLQNKTLRKMKHNSQSKTSKYHVLVPEKIHSDNEYEIWNSHTKKLNSVAIVRKQTILTKRPPLVSKVSANLRR